MSVILIRDSESSDPNVRSKKLVLNTNNDEAQTSTAASSSSAEKKQNSTGRGVPSGQGGAGIDE
jgi:hypothetical protein